MPARRSNSGGRLKSSEILEFAHALRKAICEFAKEDRIFAEDIRQIGQIISDFSFVEKINEFAAQKEIYLNAGFDAFRI